MSHFFVHFEAVLLVSIVWCYPLIGNKRSENTTWSTLIRGIPYRWKKPAAVVSGSCDSDSILKISTGPFRLAAFISHGLSTIIFLTRPSEFECARNRIRLDACLQPAPSILDAALIF